LSRARKFDEKALVEIYDTYSPGIYRYSMRLLGDAHLAEECTSETFYRFLKALRNGSGPTDHLQAYLYRVAHNWISDHYQSSPQILSIENEAVEEVTTNPLVGSSQVQADPLETAAHSIESQRVRKALTQLAPEQRQVIVLKYLEGWTNQQVAEALNKPVGAVKSLQHRAIEALRRLIGKNGGAS
jgi:RNA polymerase sigma-70 factor (ECF subfamily)